MRSSLHRSASRVAARYHESQLRIEAGARVRIPMTMYWKPAGRPDIERGAPGEADLGTIKGVVGFDVGRQWLMVDVPVIDDEGDVFTIAGALQPIDIEFLRGSDRVFRQEPKLANAIEKLLSGIGSLTKPGRTRTIAEVRGSPGALNVSFGRNTWKIRGDVVRPRASVWMQGLLDALVGEWEEHFAPAYGSSLPQAF